MESSAQSEPTAALFPLSETFQLQSRPQASKRIYLDFDGHTTTNTYWNRRYGIQSIVTPAFSLDTNYSDFSDRDLTTIQDIWARVAEDFSPFDVDVTTKAPSDADLIKAGGGDDRWGVRVVVGGDGAWQGAAGVAILGGFGDAELAPAFVHADQPWKTIFNFVAGAISHEVGHTLGLAHHGHNGSEYYGGRGNWGPLMGNPNTLLTQWSRGDYGGATNRNQDDLAVITTRAGNGFGFRPDDFGDTVSTASEPVVTPSGVLEVSGVIEKSTDADVFQFYTTGILSGTITTASVGANLDILAEVLDAQGIVIATSNPTGRLDASFNASSFSTPLQAGRYYLRVQGTGEGDPQTTGYSDYGSLGQYFVSLIIQTDVSPPAPPVIVTVNDDVTPVIGNVPHNGSTNDTTPTLLGTAEPLSTVRMYRDGTSLGTVQATAGGSWSFQSGVLTDGTYTLTATATDAAGNVSEPSTPRVVTIDTVVAPPLVVAADDDVAPGIGSVASGGHTNDTTPTIRGTAEPGSAVTVTVGSLSFGPVTADSAGAWAVTTGPLPPGPHNFVATAIDLAGNESAASEPFVLTIDIQPPSPPTISSVTDDRPPSPRVVPSGGRTGDPTLVIAGSAEAASTVTIFANGNAIGTTQSVDGTWSFTTPALPEGLVTLTARATDRAANQGDASAAHVVTVDVTPPPPPSITQVTDDRTSPGTIIPVGGATTDSSPRISGTAEPLSRIRVSSGGSLIATTDANASGAWSLTTPALADGLYMFVATSSDDVDSESDPSVAHGVTIDTTSPAPVFLHALDDIAPQTGIVPDGGHTNDASPTLVGMAEPGSTVTVWLGQTVTGTAVANPTGTWSFGVTGLSDGIHLFTARAIDLLGNQSPISQPFTLTVDTIATAPVILIATDDVEEITGPILSSGLTNDNRPLLSGTAEPGSIVTVRLGRQSFGPAVAGPTGTWAIEAGPLSDGSHALTATSVDRAGNVSSSATFQFTVDTFTTTPTLSRVDDDVPLHVGAITWGRLTNDATPTVSGMAEPGSRITVHVGALSFGPAIADGAGTWSLTIGPLSDGDHVLTATSIDAAGNASPGASTPFAIVVDTTVAAPAILGATDDVPLVIGSVSPGGTTNDSRPTFFGTAEAGHRVMLVAGDLSFGPVTVLSDGRWSLTIDSLPDGRYFFNAQTIDPAGNTKSTSDSFAITVDTVSPVITSLTSSTPGATLGIGASVSLIAAFSEPVRAGSTFVAMLSTGRPLQFVAADDGRTATGTFVVQPGESASPLEVTSLHSADSAQDDAGNLVTMPRPTIAPEPTLIIDGMVRPLQPTGFTSDVTAISVRRTPANAVQVKLNTPVTGLNSSHFRLTLNGRSVSLRGARLVGTGADYRLILPPRRTRPRGVYSLQIVPESSVRASNGATVSEPTTWYWRQGPAAGPQRARAFARFR